jgi:hypothetical protein
MACPNSARPKKARQVESKVRSMFIIFFDSKNLPWQAKQSIPLTTVTSCDDCVKMCKNIALNFGNKGTGYCNTMHRLTFPISAGNF